MVYKFPPSVEMLELTCQEHRLFTIQVADLSRHWMINNNGFINRWQINYVLPVQKKKSVKKLDLM